MTPIREPATGLLGLAAPSRADEAYERLLDMLLRHELTAETILHERRLAEFLEMSRTPVKDALLRLESEGLLTRSPGRGFAVRSFSVRELLEALHVRSVLEAEAARIAAERISPAELDRAEAEIRALLAAEAPSSEQDWEVDNRFHAMIALATGNAVLAETIQALRTRTYVFNKSRMPERFAVGHEEHLAIIGALRARDAQAARARAQEHIEAVRRSIIAKLSDIGG
ncbi:GntR family transcriptional regulator [Oceanicella sp. SM1341]|uniref:GntR family transcriptional regulator n=1 Tax=Oceanicella sp. SM1341 TaxID=1548889 RepID=UPI000E4C28E6|nr:GntR family transcriptional regulator [Oceanicella sp. SM1341]